MRRMLQRKLQSQRGASLLLALLLLLICSMVGASILMAAASNAGKHRSNLAEHQTYLALSSAVSLLCDELNAAQYTGQYQYWEEEYTNSETGETSVSYHFVQEYGIYSSELSSILLANFDAIFSKEITQKLQDKGLNTLETKTQTVIWNHNLTIRPQTDTALDERNVDITLHVVEESYAMELTATLDDYTIEAELTPTSSKPTLPTSLTNTGGTVQKTAPMTWKIGWITTGGEEEEP
ncbi:MAG: hypothetical protein Q3Y08_11340 [Butyricicoccus sp.]|nr:hypothetical protein [Butyricicoccus sp.]